ncbi:MAG: HipA domain-containing protein, partial [Promicromonosporaceae bacterium]|nr:HipA domain-containing protein [Promicromonosporaceae bacterium]
IGPDLPLEEGWFSPAPGIGMPSSIKDSSPDAWGIRTILNAGGEYSDESFLLNSGSNRIGALDFQRSPHEYVARNEDDATIAELMAAAEQVDEGVPLPKQLAAALVHATSIGGARPKATLHDPSGQWIAKFSSSTDSMNVVGAEAASIYLARKTAIEVPEARMERVMGRDVLLMRRFDRAGDFRKLMVTGVTLLGYGLGLVPRGSYPELLGRLRERGDQSGNELYARIAFNIAISNTDDHLRNHSAFWDGETLSLTPAYDLSPGPRSGETATLATPYSYSGRKEATFDGLLDSAYEFDIDIATARGIIDRVRDQVNSHWHDAADFARLTENDRKTLWGRQFQNPAASRKYLE